MKMALKDNLVAKHNRPPEEPSVNDMVADRYFNMAKSRLHRSVTNAVDCAVRIHIGVKPRQPAGAMLARGRRTASSWFRAGGVMMIGIAFTNACACRQGRHMIWDRLGGHHKAARAMWELNLPWIKFE